ncbi:cysteine protease ATG4C [Brachyhypopomus gauderio]|uniref:cysteine protease ATG4C n=1 Tax=Brachyhypopomus gauderio TaxID=698409 RepID=UPI0040429C15
METKGTDEVEKLKSRFMSAWNSVKYSWVLKTKTSFSRNSPVFLLGKCYHFKAEDEESPTENSNAFDGDSVMGDVDGFRSDFASRVWLTYREEFAPLPGSTVTSDCGWGCTLRAGQMMLAQALLLHFLGREWMWPGALTLEPLDTETRTSSAARRLVSSLESSFQGERRDDAPSVYQCQGGAEEADAHLKEVHHRTVVAWFGDTPSAQLGVHRLVHLGMTSGKRAGDWYGPAVVAHILRKAVEEATDPALRSVNVYVAQDCTVYNADVVERHSARADALRDPEGLAADGMAAVIILIPVRLGGEKINPDYFNFVKGILSLEYCIGIIGGKPKQAYYFVGFQDDSLIYMDPHYSQGFVDVSKSDFPLQSFHCPSPKKMAFIKMDPSCTIGFYSRSVQDYERISSELSKVLQPSVKDKYPAFTFMKGHGRDYELSVPMENREWPFIRGKRKAGATAGDFVLL